MSTTRSLTIGRFPIAEMTGTWPASTSGFIRSLQASTAAPSMRMPQEPQIIMRQLLRYASVPSTRSLTMSRTSSSVAHSGASTSYVFSSRSPVRLSKRQILSATSIAPPSWPFAEGAISVRTLTRLPLRHRHRRPVESRPVVLPRHDRMPQVVLVVAVRVVVRPRVRAAALLARQARDDHAVRQLEQEAELERLGEVVVEQ